MKNFAATLIREKLEFTPKKGSNAPAATVRSNRISFVLGDEMVAVRAQNMHMALYWASFIVITYDKGGAIQNRKKPVDWAGQWAFMLADYERIHNQQLWAAVYVGGKSVFQVGEIPPYLEIVEKCAEKRPEDYEATISLAESMAAMAGFPIKIDQETHIAAVFDGEGADMKANLIHRERRRSVIFNFTAGSKNDRHLAEESLKAAGAFLEAINLRFVVDELFRRFNQGEFKKVSPETRKLRNGVTRLNALNRVVNTFEKEFTVHYRPEKPYILPPDIKTALDRS